MPRRADLGEHRNDHQIATARRFAEQGRIIAVANEQELSERLDQVQTLHTAERPNIQVSSNLIGTIRTFIETHRVYLEDRDVRF
jgi:UDP-N-acetylglucosamine transferase subunit ALG13